MRGSALAIDRPTQTKRQVVVEGVVNYVADLATSTLGKRGEPFVPFFIALFVFIFLLNQFGMLPFKALGLPFGGSPTADLNTTVPLALIVCSLTWSSRFHEDAWLIKHLVRSRFAWLLPINLIEEFVRPLTLAARLFFNIFVGELLFSSLRRSSRRTSRSARSISRLPYRSSRSSFNSSTFSSARSKRSFLRCWRSSISPWRSVTSH